MSSQLHQDPTATMAPSQRQELQNAQSNPIGSVTDAAATLTQLQQARDRIVAAMRGANQTFTNDTTLPESVPESAARQVREQAEAAISTVETASRRDLAVLTARAQAIVTQLADAASEPNLSAVPVDVLDGANRYAPLIASQLADQPLPVLAKRLKSAIVRDDPSELLELSMVLAPIFYDRIDNPAEDDNERYLAYELKDIVRQVTSKWRDRSLDGTLDHAQDVAKKLVDLDHQILKDYAERTGDPDPYGYLTGMN